MSISYIANIVANFKFIHNVIITHTVIWHMNNMNNNTYVSVFLDNDLVLIQYVDCKLNDNEKFD